ncbi:MAG: response regulator, partial [Burkholderiales bacterium]|nr:response regulator [Burkholderiales bacterium]
METTSKSRDKQTPRASVGEKSVASTRSVADASNLGEPAKRRILLVDDDQDMLAVLTTVLEHGGYEIAHAAGLGGELRQRTQHRLGDA